MANGTRTKQPSKASEPRSIARLTVSGYKSISDEESIEIRPLTILAGANSSGKSSIMQPLLLLKQTLEATYDPGPLLLSGPNVEFSSSEQMLSVRPRGHAESLTIGIELAPNVSLSTVYSRRRDKPFDITRMQFREAEEETVLRPDMSSSEIVSVLPTDLKGLPDFVLRDMAGKITKQRPSKLEWMIVRDRCFLGMGLRRKDEKAPPLTTSVLLSPSRVFESRIRKIIHLPGLRGNPERNYPVTAVGSTFPGTFEKYAASVIAQWQADKQEDKLKGIVEDLSSLGLTWKVLAKPVNDTQVEILVGRLARPQRGSPKDVVSIADVGLGVSQTLPVVVADTPQIGATSCTLNSLKSTSIRERNGAGGSPSESGQKRGQNCC